MGTQLGADQASAIGDAVGGSLRKVKELAEGFGQQPVDVQDSMPGRAVAAALARKIAALELLLADVATMTEDGLRSAYAKMADGKDELDKLVSLYEQLAKNVGGPNSPQGAGTVTQIAVAEGFFEQLAAICGQLMKTVEALFPGELSKGSATVAMAADGTSARVAGLSEVTLLMPEQLVARGLPAETGPMAGRWHASLTLRSRDELREVYNVTSYGSAPGDYRVGPDLVLPGLFLALDPEATSTLAIEIATGAVDGVWHSRLSCEGFRPGTSVPVVGRVTGQLKGDALTWRKRSCDFVSTRRFTSAGLDG